MQEDKRPSPPPAVVLEIMDEKFVKAVISRSLTHRKRTSQVLRNAINGAIRTHVRVKGFRDASKAQPKLLIPAVLSEIDHRCSPLADAVVRVWEDSQKPLRDLVAKCLKEWDAAGDGALVPPDRDWTVREWRGLRSRIGEQHPELDGDGISLMLCVVTGKLPSAGYEEPEEGFQSQRFLRWVEELEHLPPDVAEWEETVRFAQLVCRIADQKLDERDNAFTRELEKLIDGVRESYKDELRYLDIDMRSWFNEASARQATIPEALEIVYGMKKELSDYHDVRPQAPSREQERSRATARDRHETAILGMLAAWNKLMEQPVDAPPPAEVREARADYMADGGPGDRPASEALQKELEALRQEKQQLQAQLKESAKAAALEKEQLNAEISTLKATLAQTQKDEQYWRAQYVDRSAEAAGAQSEDGTGATLGSVREVIAHAERTFPKQLRFALNGKSEKNAPYQKPQEVFDALAWLATEFYRVRPDPGAKVDFDRLIKEACPGWSYKPNQTETTMGMYPEWYRAVVDGKTYDLANHIGKGAGFDPQNTIRIAFAWDGEQRQVVIGYIGRHQRNRQS